VFGLNRFMWNLLLRPRVDLGDDVLPEMLLEQKNRAFPIAISSPGFSYRKAQ
jgi:hypothetical protein